MNVLYGTARVEKFALSIDGNLYGHVLSVFDRLRSEGNMLNMPFSRPLGGGLFELRITCSLQIRFFYIFKEGSAIVLHGFIKKTQQTPPKEIEYARKTMKSFRS